MKLHSRGQTLMEYAGIIILIILGMVIGKIVIDRGAKAGIKNLTQSVELSDQEIIRQAPSDPGINLPTCQCSAWSTGACGTGPCPPTSLYQYRSCAPLGCENSVNPHIITQKCTTDNNCCTDWQLLGPPALACGVNATMAPGGSCPDDTGWSTRVCGNLPAEFSCQPNPQCYFRCEFLSSKALPCFLPPQSTPCLPPACVFNGDNARLPSSMNYHYMSNSAQCNPVQCSPSNTNACCRAYCRPNFILNQQGDDCECAPGYFFDPTANDCVEIRIPIYASSRWHTSTNPWSQYPETVCQGSNENWMCSDTPVHCPPNTELESFTLVAHSSVRGPNIPLDSDNFQFCSNFTWEPYLLPPPNNFNAIANRTATQEMNAPPPPGIPLCASAGRGICIPQGLYNRAWIWCTFEEPDWFGGFCYNTPCNVTEFCPPGHTLRFIAMAGYENRPGVQDLYCKAWVENNGNSLTCKIDTNMPLNGSMGNCGIRGFGICYPSGQTANDTVINCFTQVGDQGWNGPHTAVCPPGKTLKYFGEVGNAEHTDSRPGHPDDQTCITSVEEFNNGIKCNVSAQNILGCGNMGIGVCW